MYCNLLCLSVCQHSHALILACEFLDLHSTYIKWAISRQTLGPLLLYTTDAHARNI